MMISRFFVWLAVVLLAPVGQVSAATDCPKGPAQEKRHDPGVGVGVGVSIDLGGVGKRKKEEDPFGDPPAHTYNVEEHSPHHCQGGRLMIVAGRFDAAAPENPAKGNPDICGTLAWVHQRQRNNDFHHVHFVAYRVGNSGEAIEMKEPFLLDAGGWKKTGFNPRGGDQTRGRLASEELSKAWADCCYYDEVIIIMHGSENAYAELRQFLPYVLARKPVRKFVLWSCQSSNKFKPSSSGADRENYEALCQMVRPHDCPCECDHDKCNGFDADGKRRKCPTGDDKTTIYASFAVGDVPATLGIIPKDPNEGHAKGGERKPYDPSKPFTSPDGHLRKITVDKDGNVEAGDVNVAKDGDVLFDGLKGQADPGLIKPKTERTETVDPREMLKKIKLGAPKAPSKALPPSPYFGPKACPEKEGCLPGSRPPVT